MEENQGLSLFGNKCDFIKSVALGPQSLEPETSCGMLSPVVLEWVGFLTEICNSREHSV